jgi:8-amino-7-oxononanoate synthase
VTVPGSWEAHLDHELERLGRQGLLRRLTPVERGRAPFVVRNGKRLVSFASNDYLGLASHPALAQAAYDALHRGSGATASRLVSGGDPDYHALEARLSRFKGTEDALIFGNGYLANVGVIGALVGRGDAVFSDRLNHASVLDGCRISGASIHRYAHRDTGQLEAMLDEAQRNGERRKLIVSETVFGMEGDLAPLAEIAELKERYGAALMVDEAHAGGVFGPHGEGYAYEQGLAGSVDLHMGTFGKAFGVYGAYVAASEKWIRYLVNTCRSFIYTTALPPPVIGAIGAAVELVSSAHEERKNVRAMSERFRAGLRSAGFSYGGSSTQIVPVMIGGSSDAVKASLMLEERGVLAPAMRPPTVPAGKACLRFSISSAHGPDHIDQALAALEDVGPWTQHE